MVPAKPVKHAPAVSPYRTELKVALKSVVASQVTAVSRGSRSRNKGMREGCRSVRVLQTVRSVGAWQCAWAYAGSSWWARPRHRTGCWGRSRRTAAWRSRRDQRRTSSWSRWHQPAPPRSRQRSSQMRRCRCTRPLSRPRGKGIGVGKAAWSGQVGGYVARVRTCTGQAGAVVVGLAHAGRASARRVGAAHNTRRRAQAVWRPTDHSNAMRNMPCTVRVCDRSICTQSCWSGRRSCRCRPP